MSQWLHELGWEAVRERVPAQTDLVWVPVGTLEAHAGLPVGTDTIIPSGLAVDLSSRLGGLIAPAVPYGVTNSLLPYPGSTTVSPATFVAYLFEAAAGLVDTGFRRVVLLNGHGGQTREVHEVVNRLWAERRAFAVAVEWWGVADAITRELYGEIVSGHAGVEETAMVLAIAPHTVDGDRHRTARRVPLRAGVKARPFPATIILPRPAAGDEAASILDLDLARRFHGRTVDTLESVLREVFEGWDELRAP